MRLNGCTNSEVGENDLESEKMFHCDDSFNNAFHSILHDAFIEA